MIYHICHSVRTASPILTFCSFLLPTLTDAPPARDQVIVAQHQGDADPESVGWALVFSGAGRGPQLGPVDDNGTPAWQIDEITGGNNNFAYYLEELPDPLMTDANLYGWSLRARLRIPDFETANNGALQRGRLTAPGFVLRDSTTSRLWYVGFGLSEFNEGNTLLQTLTEANSSASLGPTFELVGNDEYFDVELRFDPATSSADLIVNDAEVISDYESFSPPIEADASSVEWGDVSGADVGIGNFNALSLVIHTLPAVPRVTPDPIALGDFHIGQSAEQPLTISNDASPGNFSEDLAATITSSGDATVAGGANVVVAPGASDSSLQAVIDASTVGHKNGDVEIDSKSRIPTAAGIPARDGDLELGVTTIPVTASVYRLAQAALGSNDPIDFGVVHVGDSPTFTLAVQNSAADDGFSELLDAAFGAANGGVVTSGVSIDNLAPQATDSESLKVGIDATVAGMISGSVQVEFTSDGDGVNALGQTTLPSATIAVTGVVNAYAQPAFAKEGGDGELLEQDANAYTLDLGTVAVGAGALTAELSLANSVSDPADDLAGDWSLEAVDFTLSGFDAFSALAASASLGGLTVGLATDAPGDFNGVITLSPRSENEASFSGALDDVTIQLRAAVVIPGDFDADSDVDGADFLAWQRGESPSALSFADLATWQENFGAAFLSPNSTSIPEPSSTAYTTACLTVAASLASWRRHRSATSGARRQS
ncbi:MAG: choice-of-anchor D domain-containing protein [Planctomycetota bacterium]